MVQDSGESLNRRSLGIVHCFARDGTGTENTDTLFNSQYYFTSIGSPILPL